MANNIFVQMQQKKKSTLRVEKTNKLFDAVRSSLDNESSQA